MKDTNGDIIEFTTTSYSFKIYNETNYYSGDCYDVETLSSRMTSPARVTLSFDKSKYFYYNNRDFQFVYGDSLSSHADTLATYRIGYFVIGAEEDCSIPERFYSDSLTINNTLYRDLYKVEEDRWHDPDYSQKARFQYIYFSSDGKILKLESDTEVWKVI